MEHESGHEKKSLGPSDSSDSGSDLVGTQTTADDMEGTGDRAGTGEGLPPERAPQVKPGADVGTDRVVDADEAGLGGGLDEAEEALAKAARSDRAGGR